MPGNPNSLLSQGARVAFFLLRTLHRTADRQPASSSCFHFSSCSSYPPGPIQAGDQESQPTSRSQSKARWLCPLLQSPQRGSLRSSPGLSTKEGHQGNLGTGCPKVAAMPLPISPISLPPGKAVMSAGHAGLMGYPRFPLSLQGMPSM